MARYALPAKPKFTASNNRAENQDLTSVNQRSSAATGLLGPSGGVAPPPHYTERHEVPAPSPDIQRYLPPPTAGNSPDFEIISANTVKQFVAVGPGEALSPSAIVFQVTGHSEDTLAPEKTAIGTPAAKIRFPLPAIPLQAAGVEIQLSPTTPVHESVTAPGIQRSAGNNLHKPRITPRIPQFPLQYSNPSISPVLATPRTGLPSPVLSDSTFASPATPATRLYSQYTTPINRPIPGTPLLPPKFNDSTNMPAAPGTHVSLGQFAGLPMYHGNFLPGSSVHAVPSTQISLPHYNQAMLAPPVLGAIGINMGFPGILSSGGPAFDTIGTQGVAGMQFPYPRVDGQPPGSTMPQSHRQARRLERKAIRAQKVQQRREKATAKPAETHGLKVTGGGVEEKQARVTEAENVVELGAMVTEVKDVAEAEKQDGAEAEDQAGGEPEQEDEEVTNNTIEDSEAETAPGDRPCVWKIYGCQSVVSMPVTGFVPGEVPKHENVCAYRVDPEVDEVWKMIRAYQEEYPQTKLRLDVLGLLASSACKFGPVKKYNKADRKKATGASAGVVSWNEPLLFQPSDVWEKGVPPESKVWNECFHAPPQAGTCIEPANGDYLTIMHQLHWKDHSPSDVQYVMNVSPDNLSLEYPLSAPSPLIKDNNHVIGYEGYNITPLHSWVDLHVDRGQDRIATLIGEAEKVWFLWPATRKNERMFYERAFLQERSPSSRLAQIAPNLEGGRIVRTTKDSALFVPAGWIHCVLTVRGGILAGYTWTTDDRIDSVLKCLELEIKLRHDLEGSGLSGAVCLAMDLLDLELMDTGGDTLKKTITKWIKLIELLSSRSDCQWETWGEVIEKRSFEIMTELSGRGRALPAVCPCGISKRLKSQMGEHMKSHAFQRAGPQETPASSPAPSLAPSPVKPPPAKTRKRVTFREDSEQAAMEAGDSDYEPKKRRKTRSSTRARAKV